MHILVCDICKKEQRSDKSEQVYVTRIIVEKEYIKNKKVVKRKVITIPMDLCDPCITTLNQALGGMVNTFRQSTPGKTKTANLEGSNDNA